MTLTALLPSLRRTLPDPIRIDSWPEFTVSSTTDVTVAGVSLLRLVEWCETPCVHTAAAVIRGTHGRPSETELASVVVTRVLAVVTGDDGTVVVIDAELHDCTPVLAETRLIGRASTAHTRRVSLVTTGSADPVTVSLPADLAAGDLLVLPCLGATCLHEVRPHAQSPRAVVAGDAPERCAK